MKNEDAFHQLVLTNQVSLDNRLKGNFFQVNYTYFSQPCMESFSLLQVHGT